MAVLRAAVDGKTRAGRPQPFRPGGARQKGVGGYFWTGRAGRRRRLCRSQDWVCDMERFPSNIPAQGSCGITLATCTASGVWPGMRRSAMQALLHIGTILGAGVGC